MCSTVCCCTRSLGMTFNDFDCLFPNLRGRNVDTLLHDAFRHSVSRSVLDHVPANPWNWHVNNLVPNLRDGVRRQFAQRHDRKFVLAKDACSSPQFLPESVELARQRVFSTVRCCTLSCGMSFTASMVSSMSCGIGTSMISSTVHSSGLDS